MKKRIIPFFAVITLLFCMFSSSAAAVGDVIDFTRDSIDLYLNQSYQLTMKNNAPVISYTSSDPDIVSVSHTGMIKAETAGSSILTATDKEGNKATCTVHVWAGTAPEKVVLEIQSLSMTEGAYYTLKAKVLPEDVDDGRVYFSSSDETVAKVDSKGTIKALKVGTAVITAESSSAAVSTKCMVKVVSKSGRKYSVSLNGTLYSAAGEKKANMRVEIANANESFETTTDVDGKFYFDDIVRGSYILRVFKSEKTTTPTAMGQLSVGSHDMNMSCIISDKDLIVLYQNEEEGTEKLQDIILEKNTLNLQIGESYDMSFRVRPAHAILPAMKNISSNEKVAKVDIDGRITAVAEGTAVITFSTSDKSITKSCKVTVSAVNSNTYSWIIITVEFSLLLLIVIVFFIAYSKFKYKREREEGVVNPKYGRRVK